LQHFIKPFKGKLLDNILLIILVVLLLIAIVLIIVFRNKNNSDLPELKQQLAALQANLAKIESNLKEDFKINREENAGIAKDNRFELNNTLKTITEPSAARN
jgi:flagellar basal body-associated protein FliL